MSLPSQHLNNAHRRSTVARLVSECERIISSGSLPERDELRLREYTNAACAAHEMETVVERVIQVGDHTAERAA